MAKSRIAATMAGSVAKFACVGLGIGDQKAATPATLLSLLLTELGTVYAVHRPQHYAGFRLCLQVKLMATEHMPSPTPSPPSHKGTFSDLKLLMQKIHTQCTQYSTHI